MQGHGSFSSSSFEFLALLGYTTQRGGILRAGKLLAWDTFERKQLCVEYMERKHAENRNKRQIKTDLHSLVRPSAYNSCLRSEKKAESLRP